MGLNVLTQESTGTLEPHGLMPERFTDQRARRPMVAANFEREGRPHPLLRAVHRTALAAGCRTG